MGTLVYWYELSLGETAPCYEIFERLRERCSLPVAEFHVSLLDSSGERMRFRPNLHAGDYTMLVTTGFVDSSPLCLKDTEGRMLSSWVLSIPGSPHLGQNMPVLDENAFVEARIEIPEEWEDNSYSDSYYSDSDTT